MIVSHANRFIFFHNPKCAGMSFRQVLQPYHDDPVSFWGAYQAPYFKNMIDHSHLRLWELLAQFPSVFACAERYNSVIFVRDPWSRFLSALNEHFKKFQPQIDLAGMAPGERVAVVEAFIAKLLHVSRITTDWRFVHFSPQIWFLKLGDRQIPRHVIPMQDGSLFTRAGLAALGLPDLEVPSINPSPVDLSAARDSAVVRRFVETFYSDDMAFFRANPMLAEALQAS